MCIRDSLTVREIEEMRASLKKSYLELGNILKDISNTVAHLTNYTTLISTPCVATNILKSIRLIPLDEKRLVMLVVNSGGIVKNTTITAKGGVDAKVLERLGNYLNLTFCAVSYTHLDVYKRQGLQLCCRRPQHICGYKL